MKLRIVLHALIKRKRLIVRLKITQTRLTNLKHHWAEHLNLKHRWAEHLNHLFLFSSRASKQKGTERFAPFCFLHCSMLWGTSSSSTGGHGSKSERLAVDLWLDFVQFLLLSWLSFIISPPDIPEDSIQSLFCRVIDFLPKQKWSDVISSLPGKGSIFKHAGKTNRSGSTWRQILGSKLHIQPQENSRRRGL